MRCLGLSRNGHDINGLIASASESISIFPVSEGFDTEIAHRRAVQAESVLLPPIEKNKGTANILRVGAKHRIYKSGMDHKSLQLRTLGILRSLHRFVAGFVGETQLRPNRFRAHGHAASQYSFGSSL